MIRRRFSFSNALILLLASASIVLAGYTGDFIHLVSTGVVSWNSDAGLSRVSSDTVAVGHGIAADTSTSISCSGVSWGLTDLTTFVVATLPGNSAGYTNDNAAIDQALTLPSAPAIGTRIKIVVASAHYMKLIAPASVVINLGSSSSSRAGFVRSNVVGSTVTLENVSAALWVSDGLTGTWTIDS